MKISLTKEDFKFQYDYQSRIARLLQNIELRNITQFELELLPDQEIDDNDFQNTILYLEQFQSLKQFKIDTKHRNYLSPRTYKQILACLPQSLNQLDIFVSNKVDFEAITWISIFEVLSQRRFTDFIFIVANIFEIKLTNKCFNLKVFESQNLDQQNYQQIAQFCLNQDFKIFNISVGNNTRVDRYLSIFDTAFRRKQIEELQINIGDSTSFQSESITSMIKTNAFVALKTLKIQIGDQNSIDDKFAESIFLLLPSIQQLDLNVGHSNRLFQYQYAQPVQIHQLQVLNLTLGRSNNLTKYGFTYLSNLVRSQSLIYLSLDLSETVVQDVTKSFYLFSCISNIRSLQSLKIILDRNFIFDSKTLSLLGEIVKNNKNLKQFIFNPKQSQKIYIIMDSILTYFDQSNIINLEIRFAQSFILQSADSLLALQNCNHLTSLKLIFVNDNGLSDFNICYKFGVNICAIKSLTTLHLEFDNQSLDQQEQNTAKIFQNLAEYIMIHRKDLILNFKYQDTLLISYNILTLKIKSYEVNNFDNYFPTKSIIIEQKNQEIKSSIIKWIAKAFRELDDFQIIYKNFNFEKQNQMVSLKCPQQLLSLLYQYEPKFEINRITILDDNFSYLQFFKDLYYFLSNVTEDEEYSLFIENTLMKIQIHNELAYLELKINIENVSEFVLFCRALEQLIPKIQKLELKFSTTLLSHIDWTNFDRAICASNHLRGLALAFTQQQQQYSVEIFSKIIDSYFNIITSQPILLHFDFELLFVITFPNDIIEILEQQIKWEHEQQWDDNGLAQFDEDGNIIPNQNQNHPLPQVPGIQNFDQHQHQVVKAQRLALLQSTKIKLDKIIQLKKQRRRILLQMMIAQKKFMNRFKKKKIIQEIINLL